MWAENDPFLAKVLLLQIIGFKPDVFIAGVGCPRASNQRG